jgi:hypothetical protein
LQITAGDGKYRKYSGANSVYDILADRFDKPIPAVYIIIEIWYMGSLQSGIPGQQY